MTLAAPLIALGGAILLNLALNLVMGKAPLRIFYAMLLEPFLSWASFSEVLLKTGPLLLIAEGLAIGFRARVFNIGAEGRFILGAICASAIPVWSPEVTGGWIWPAMLIMGALGGAFWAAIAAFWRVRLDASEILPTLMLSLIAAQLLYCQLLGPWKDPAGFNFPQSVMFQMDAMLPTLFQGTRVNVSLLLAILSVALVWVYKQRSFGGYQLLVGGLAPRAATYAGFPQGRAIWILLMIGRLAAGVAGAAEVTGPVGQLQRSISTGHGYAAIIVAYLGGMHSLGIALSSLLMTALYIGGDNAMVSADLPVAAVRVFQGSLLAFYLVAATFGRYRIDWGRTVIRGRA